MREILFHAAIYVPVAIVAAFAMELWAGLLHGLVWHRWLWRVHVSHHRARAPGSRFEANDVLSATHAPISIALILWGCRAAPSVAREVAFGAGLGMALFGIAYLVFHDGLVHRRLPVRWLLRFGYVREVMRAHLIHHTGRDGRAPYGFFLGPRELVRGERARVMRSRSTPNESAPRPSATR